METKMLACIQERKSIRRFVDDKIDNEKITCILQAGMRAPSAHNQQAWQFVVIRKEDLIREFADYLVDYRACETAPVVILLCARQESLLCPGHWVQDLAASMVLMWLEAEHQGLGAVWMGIAPIEERMSYFQKKVGLGENMLLFGLLALGYPAAPKGPAVDRFDPEKIMYID